MFYKAVYILLFFITILNCNFFVPISKQRLNDLPIVSYSSNSPWNMPIPNNPVIHSNSDIMIEKFREVALNKDFTVGLSHWTVTVFAVSSNTPRYDIPLTQRWGPKGVYSVPIPEYSLPDPEADSQIAFIDRDNNWEYDFWIFRREKGNWIASGGAMYKLDGIGIALNGYSCRGSGFALLAGVIWPQELEAGLINHALICSYLVRKDLIVYPATATDGWIDKDWAIPMGARIQLDPAVDLEALDLNPYQKTIARALQVYGMIIGDSSDTIELEAVNYLSFKTNPYKYSDNWNIFKTINLVNLPLDKFRVLDWVKIDSNSLSTNYTGTFWW